MSSNELHDAAILVRSALQGDAPAVRSLVERLTPVIQARVARALIKRAGRSQGRDVRQEVNDMVQEVFLALFENDGRALRAWDPTRTVPLECFVGVVAEHQVASILRCGRRSPWSEKPLEPSEIAPQPSNEASPELVAASRETLKLVLEGVRARLSPQGILIMDLLLVERRSVEEVCEMTGLGVDAVYARRSRIAKLAREVASKLEIGRRVSGCDVSSRTTTRDVSP